MDAVGSGEALEFGHKAIHKLSLAHVGRYTLRLGSNTNRLYQTGFVDCFRSS